MSIKNATSSTVTTLLGTVTTTANVANALLNSANIGAIELQASVQNWAKLNAQERKLSEADLTNIALDNHAQKTVTRIENMQTWFQQNPNREAAYLAAREAAAKLLATP